MSSVFAQVVNGVKNISRFFFFDSYYGSFSVVDSLCEIAVSYICTSSRPGFVSTCPVPTRSFLIFVRVDRSYLKQHHASLVVYMSFL